MTRTTGGLAGLWGPTELIVLTALVPVFWFPERWPTATVAGIALTLGMWLGAWRLRQRLPIPSGVLRPLTFVLFATAVATTPVVDWSLSLPKVLGMILGSSVLLALTQTVRSPRALQLALSGLGLGSLALGVVGLVGVEWNEAKLPLLGPIYSHLPVLIRGVVAHTKSGAIHPNELAGSLVLLLPTLLLVGGVSARRGRRVQGGLLVLAGAVDCFVLLLTQSRSGIAGAVVVLLAAMGAVVVRFVRRGPGFAWRWGALVLYWLVLSGSVWAAYQVVARWVSPAANPTVLDTFKGRLELWDRSVYMLQDFPLTGIGIGQFNKVLHALYVPFLLTPDTYVPHAHDVYLEFALELGIPGFLAFSWLVAEFFRSCWRAWRSPDSQVRWVAAGLALGMVAFGVYGLADAIAPGARAGIFLWVVLGLGGALNTLPLDSAAPEPTIPHGSVAANAARVKRAPALAGGVDSRAASGTDGGTR